MSEFKVIETQEQLDAIIGERIKRAEQKAADKYADYDDLKSQNDDLAKQISDLTEQIKAKEEKITENNSEVDDLKAKIKDYETRSVKTRIAHEVGLPYQLAEKLTGDTEDAIRDDAKKMASFITKPSTPLGGAEPVVEEGNQNKMDLAAMAHQLQEVIN